MCGHFGWYIHTNVKSRKLAVMAALMGAEMETRGPQSFGYYQPTVKDENGNLGRMVKEVGAVTEKACALDMARGGILIAHTRQATTGSVIAENSHPFIVKGKERTVVGAHNGIIQDHDELNKTYQRGFKVDSQHIFGHIADGLNLADLSGYGAIVYMASDYPGRVFLGRFNSGQLSIWGIGKGPDTCTGVVWASTERACTRGLKMAGIEDAFEYECKDDKLYYIERGRLVSAKMTIPIMPSTTYRYSKGSYKGGIRKWPEHGEVESWRGTNTTVRDFRLKKGKKGDDEKTKDYPGYVCQQCHTDLKNEEHPIYSVSGWICRFCFGMFCRTIASFEKKEKIESGPTPVETKKEDERLPVVYASGSK